MTRVRRINADFSVAGKNTGTAIGTRMTRVGQMNADFFCSRKEYRNSHRNADDAGWADERGFFLEQPKFCLG